MKTKVLLSAILAVAVLAFIFSRPNAKESDKQSMIPATTDTFMIGAFCSGNLGRDTIKNELGFNFWHKYLNAGYNETNQQFEVFGWTDHDLIFDTSETYKNEIKNLLELNDNSGLKTHMHRPKLEWLGFGQRSDYQCEATVDNQDLRFYAYREHDVQEPYAFDDYDNTQFGTGEKVRRCKIDNSSTPEQRSGYVVRDVITKREQINTYPSWGGAPYPGLGDKQFDWYIKPRIRIDSNDAYANKKVCRIEVRNYNDSILKNTDIYGYNFLDTGIYNGKYLEEYFNLSPQNQLKILGNRDTSRKGNAFNPYDSDFWSSNNHVDFKVFWYGECDMWLDYVRVEDERAYNLFGDFVTNSMTRRYYRFIEMEAELAQHTNSPFRFYTEEFEFNHLQCLKYVYNKLYQLTGKRVSVYNCPTEGWYFDHLPGDYPISNPIQHFSRYALDSLRVQELMFAWYPFSNDKNEQGQVIDTTYIPKTLPKISGSVQQGFTINYKAVPPSTYDNWLQSFLDDPITGHWGDGKFVGQLKAVRDACRLSGINFIPSIQTHVHHARDGGLREPTNEELDLMVNLSVSYGQKE